MNIYRLSVFLTLLLGVNAWPAGLCEINPPSAPTNFQTTALIGARLIDGHGGNPVEGAIVMVRGNKITAVGRSMTIPPGTEKLYVSGMSILPGLFDSHFHSVNDLEKPVDYLLSRGVTTLRDPGHPFRFYQAVMQTDLAMPRVFLCGAHLDTHPAVWPQQAVLVKDADHARKAVIDHVGRGASAIKIYFRLPLKYHTTVCQTAEEQGVLVTAHLELVDATDAINAGVRGIEHVTSFGTSLAAPAEAEDFRRRVRADPNARKKLRHQLWAGIDLDAPRVKPVLDLIVEKGVFVSPTLGIFEKRIASPGNTERDVRAFENMLRFVRLCHEAGAKTVVGSHTHHPFAKRGTAYQHEMELLLRCGMTPLEVLSAATIRNAEFFGAQDRLGSIEKGKLADLVLVEGDPSQDIGAMNRVKHVMLNGRWIGEAPR
ncbi:MAG: amidohydrolase [Verrucomicrobiales bacterium]|nr:amidohydrolase [Verrucomicrobiales bacterium]